MQKKRILASFLLVCMLLTMLAACGSSSSETEETTTTEAATEETEEETEEAAEEETEEAEEETAAEEAEEAEEEAEETEEETEEEEIVIGPDYYYLQEETTEVTFLFSYSFFFASYFTEGWGSSPWWDALEEKLNVEFVLTEVPSNSYSEKMNLSIVSGDMADLMSGIANAYSTGAAGALADEVIYDLRDYLEEYAPTYWEWITSDEDTLRDSMTDDGAMPVMYNIMTEAGQIDDGLWIRMDWLDELGLEVPTTTDEFYDVLLAFKNEYGSTATYYQMISGDTSAAGITAEGVWNAFGPTNFYVKEDGTVGYGPSEDYYFEYLAYLKKLASAGLFITSDITDDSSSDLFAQGNIGVNGDSADNVPSYLALLDDDDAYMRAMAALGEPTEYGEHLTLTDGDSIAAAALSISTSCEYPELIVQITEYLFSEEGSLLASYGIEGLSYELVDGEPVYTDLITNNETGMPVRAALGYYTNPGLCALITARRTAYLYEDWQNEASEIWESAYTGNSGTLPTDYLSFTTDEQDEISLYFTDMITYIDEFVYGVVFGDTELTDDVIDNYLDTLENTMHLSTILECYNSAYQRYLNR